MNLGVHAPNTKECAVCAKPFTPRLPLQRVCGFVCAKRVPKLAKKAEREAVKERKRAIERVRDVKPVAQEWFNKFIRLRDKDKPCVSCGIENPPMTPGGQWDAGHFLSRGSHPELSFDEDNCHKQCKSCNGGGGKFKHKERVVSERYEEELTNRIGPERLARLRGPHEVKKLTVDYLRGLIEIYKAKCKELE